MGATPESNDEKEARGLKPQETDAKCGDASFARELSEEEKQEQYRREYLRQLRLRSCPGCGEQDLF